MHMRYKNLIKRICAAAAGAALVLPYKSVDAAKNYAA